MNRSFPNVFVSLCFIKLQTNEPGQEVVEIPFEQMDFSYMVGDETDTKPCNVVMQVRALMTLVMLLSCTPAFCDAFIIQVCIASQHYHGRTSGAVDCGFGEILSFKDFQDLEV